MLPEATAWRHDFHQHPELQFDVLRTAARVAELCRSFGCDEVVEGIGLTGVIAVIKGCRNASGRVIGLRPTWMPCRSLSRPGPTMPQRPMARCMPVGMTGTLRCCWGPRNTWPRRGTLMVRQSGSFSRRKGRRRRAENVRDGMMERWGIQGVYGMHNMPGIPVGEFAIRAGAMMAAAVTVEITVTGKGGHAAKPHDCIDTTVVAAHIIVALQTIASRGVDPLKQVVVSICAVETNSPGSRCHPAGGQAEGHCPHHGFRGAGFCRASRARDRGGGRLWLWGQAEVTYDRGYP